MENEEVGKVKEELDKLLGDDEKSLLLDLVLQLKQNSKKHSVSIEKLEGIKKEIFATNKITAENFDTLLKAFVQFKLPEVYPVLVKNSIKLEKPDWFNLAPVVKAIEVISKQATQIQKVSIVETNDPTKPVAVRLTDGKRFYTAIMQAFSSLGGKFKFSEDGRLLVDIGENITVNVGSEVEVTNEEGNPIPVSIGNFPSDFPDAAVLEELGEILTELTAIKGFVDEIEGKLDTLNATDFATETTLAAIGVAVDQIEGILTSLDGKDFATETTLAAAKVVLDDILTELTTLNAFDFATETTLAEISSKLDDIIAEASDPSNLWQKETFDGKGFAVTTGTVAVALTTETDFLLLKNPSASGKLMRLKEFGFVIDPQSVAGQPPATLIRAYRAPTITTNGTALTIAKVRSSQSQATIAEAYLSPTISDRGTLIQVFSVLSTLERDTDLARYLEEGNNILFTVQGSRAGLSHSISAAWLEE